MWISVRPVTLWPHDYIWLYISMAIFVSLRGRTVNSIIFHFSPFPFKLSHVACSCSCPRLLLEIPCKLIKLAGRATKKDNKLPGASGMSPTRLASVLVWMGSGGGQSLHGVKIIYCMSKGRQCARRGQGWAVGEGLWHGGAT